MNVQPTTTHLTASQLAAFALGKLTDAQMETVQRHLEACEACRQAAGKVPADSFIGLVRSAGAGVSIASSTPLPSAQGLEPSRFEQGAKAELPEVFGRYRILKKLGQGGMGAVYQARDTQLNRLVALKVPHFRADATKQVYDRFYQEARAAAAFDHPNLCPVYDVGCIDGVHYLTMPFIEGKSLSDFIQPNKPQGSRQVASVVRKLALALQEAHKRGVIHRDLKPTNVMINLRKEPVIMDFGLARLESGEEARLTAAGVILGTPAYMAPEQVLGEIDKIGPRCDIYSLGVMLYELLTGQLPFQGSITAVLAQIVTAEPMPPSQLRQGIDPVVEAICLKAMAKNPEARHASMAELATTLTAYLKNTGGPALPVAAPVATMTAPANNPDCNPFEAIQAEPLVSVKSEAPPARPRSARAQGSRSPRRWLFAAVCGLAGVILLGAVLYVATDNGRVRIEINDPKAKVDITVDGELITLTTPDDTVKLRVGPHELEVKGNGFKTYTKKFIVRRGETDLVNVLLEPNPPVAERLGEPVKPADPRPPLHKELANSISMKLTWVPPGEFRMGSAGFAKHALEDEKPPHLVTISKGFYMGVCEVTQEQYQQVMNVNPSHFSPIGAGKDKVANLDWKRLPVEQVTWDKAVDFCRKLSEMPAEKAAGRAYRLPTEAEWEYACRAGTTTITPVGDSISSYEANFNGNYPLTGDPVSRWLNRTNLVGTYEPNKFGLYDMTGNVWEWCADGKRSYDGVPRVDPRGPDDGTPRMIRGGGWASSAIEMRSAHRRPDNLTAEVWQTCTGLRVVMTLTSSPALRPPFAVEPMATPGFTLLFNGKDLTGWKTHADNPGSWGVENGTLVGRGPTPSLLFTERDNYTNFHLRAEARINSGGDSGLCFRIPLIDYRLNRVQGRGYEAQINNTAGSFTGSLMHFPTTKITERLVPPGEWFTLEAIADGNHFVIKVNDKKTVDYLDADNTYRQGHVAVQVLNPATVIEFRKIEIKELPANQAEGATNPGPVPPPVPFNPPVLNFKMTSLDGKPVELSKYQGKVVLLVNVASQCGYTPQYKGLQALHDKYGPEGLVVLGVPSNDYGNQEPGSSAQIADFCEKTYAVKFDMLAKVGVAAGKNQCPLYKFLTSKDTNPKFGGDVKWNFEKFLISRTGEIVGRYESSVKPDARNLLDRIEAELGKK